VTVAVIGAGVFGAWTALQVRRAGHDVTLIDAFGPANGRASSADHSRVIRAGYGADAAYSRWATESLQEWQALAADSTQTLLTITGALFLGEPGNAYVRATHDTLQALQLPCEMLDAGQLARRFPQIDTRALGQALLEPGGGVVRARAAVQATVARAVIEGVRYEQARVQAPDETAIRSNVRRLDGSVVSADTYVFACGPWLAALFPDTIGARLRVTRQEVLYFGVPAGTAQFSAPLLPVWIDFSAGLYGIPDIDAMGFKVGIDRHGPPIDPDGDDRVLDHRIVEDTRTWLRRRFPGLGDPPLVDARVCQYENTSSGDFIIDRHPRWENVWLVGGGSGHGFKHGPAVGRYLARLLEGRTAAEPRFTLASKSEQHARAVY
jgi:glycine/D-amino acid oxidase-like deaminating enzyme